MEETKKIRKLKRARTAKPSQKPKQLAPQKLKLLVTVVNRNKAEFYADLLQSFEVNMQMLLLAQGTAKSDTLKLLGLEETGKTVILSLIREDRSSEALAALGEKFNSIKNGKGIAYTIPLSSTIGVAIYRFLCNNKANMKEEK